MPGFERLWQIIKAALPPANPHIIAGLLNEPKLLIQLKMKKQCHKKFAIVEHGQGANTACRAALEPPGHMSHIVVLDGVCSFYCALKIPVKRPC